MTTTPRVHWWIGLTLLALGGVLGLVFIGPKTSLPVAARKTTEENVLRIVYTQALRPDPHVRPFPLSTYNHFILSLWEPLVECHPATGEPHPAAAESWSWSPDWADISFRRSQIEISAAPTPYVTSQEIGNSPGGTGLFPATNPFNPFGQNVLDLRWRLAEIGRRVQDITADSPRIVIGLDGNIPNTDWTWTGALLYSKNSIAQLSRNSSSDQLVQNALNGIVLNGVLRHANPRIPDPVAHDRPGPNSTATTARES